MIGRFGLVPADHQLAEVLVAQHGAKCAEGLAEDFFAMGNEEERGAAFLTVAFSPVVEGDNHRLARPGRRDDQVPVLPLDFPLGGQDFEDFLLERVGSKVEGHEGVVSHSGSLPFPEDCGAQTRLARGRERLEFVVVPVRFEGCHNLRPKMGKFVLADLARPLQTFGEGRLGEVCRTDVRAAEAALAMEDVSLGVQSGAGSVVADADLGVGKASEQFHRPRVGGAHVAGRQHTEPRAVSGRGGCQPAQVVDQQPQAAPLDERAEDIDAVGRCELFAELHAKRRVEARSGQQSGSGERSVGAAGLRTGAVPQRQQSPQGFGKEHRGGWIFSKLFGQGTDEPVGQPALPLAAVAIAHGGQESDQHGLDVLRDRGVAVLRIQRRCNKKPRIRNFCEHTLKFLADQVIVEARAERAIRVGRRRHGHRKDVRYVSGIGDAAL